LVWEPERVSDISFDAGAIALRQAWHVTVALIPKPAGLRA